VFGPLPHADQDAPPAPIRKEHCSTVAVKIKLARFGKIREPHYRIVVADSRTRRSGRTIENIGLYQPKADWEIVRKSEEKLSYGAMALAYSGLGRMLPQRVVRKVERQPRFVVVYRLPERSAL